MPDVNHEMTMKRLLTLESCRIKSSLDYAKINAFQVWAGRGMWIQIINRGDQSCTYCGQA
jgi:hypothetical protein